MVSWNTFQFGCFPRRLGLWRIRGRWKKICTNSHFFVAVFFFNAPLAYTGPWPNWAWHYFCVHLPRRQRHRYVAFCFGSRPQNSATNREIPVPWHCSRTTSQETSRGSSWQEGRDYEIEKMSVRTKKRESVHENEKDQRWVPYTERVQIEYNGTLTWSLHGSPTSEFSRGKIHDEKKKKKTENATKEIVEWSEEEKERHWKFKQKMKLTVTRRQSLASTVGCW